MNICPTLKFRRPNKLKVNPLTNKLDLNRPYALTTLSKVL